MGRGRGRPSGAPESQLFFVYVITGIFSNLDITTTTTTTEQHYIIRIAKNAPVRCKYAILRNFQPATDYMYYLATRYLLVTHLTVLVWMLRMFFGDFFEAGVEAAEKRDRSLQGEGLPG